MTETTPQPPKPEPELPKFLSNPERADIILFIALIVMGIFSLCMIPLRAWMLTQPLAYTLIVGGYTSAVVGGANASVENGIWWVYWLCTLIGALKFMPVYWLMGKRWGMEFIDMSLQYMPRFHRMFKNPSTPNPPASTPGSSASFHSHTSQDQCREPSSTQWLAW